MGRNCIDYFELYQEPRKLDAIVEEGFRNIDAIFQQCQWDLDTLQKDYYASLWSGSYVPTLICKLRDDEIGHYAYHFVGGVALDEEARSCFITELRLDSLQGRIVKIEKKLIWKRLKKALQRLKFIIVY